jgi:hypothetical protein
VLEAAGQFGDDPAELIPGGSGIIGPDSQWIAGPVVGREEIVYADVDIDAIAGEQMAFDAAGHYNRPDIFQLTVDDRPRNQVTWMAQQQPALQSPPFGQASTSNAERSANPLSVERRAVPTD